MCVAYLDCTSARRSISSADSIVECVRWRLALGSAGEHRAGIGWSGACTRADSQAGSGCESVPGEEQCAAWPTLCAGVDSRDGSACSGEWVSAPSGLPAKVPALAGCAAGVCVGRARGAPTCAAGAWAVLAVPGSARAGLAVPPSARSGLAVPRLARAAAGWGRLGCRSPSASEAPARSPCLLAAPAEPLAPACRTPQSLHLPGTRSALLNHAL